MKGGFNMVKIAPSILAADFSALGQQVEAVSNADWIHIDVMDGHFVPNITMGPAVVAALRQVTRRPLDVHLMINEPVRYIEDFATAGADWITVHAEACRHLHSTLQSIQSLETRVGVALNPATPVETITHVLHLVDLVLIMTVNPGFGGQRFLSECVSKVAQVNSMIRKMDRKIEIQVDGGIDETTIAAPAKAGATVFVAGTSVFKTPSPADAVDMLREKAKAAISV